jgi:peptidoglycan/xylan/chitin deacetylase (PgdA/CDA1 family)
VRIPEYFKDLVGSLARPLFGGIGCIVALHRIVPEKQLSPIAENRALELTPQALHALLDWTRRRGFDVIRMDEVKNRLSEPRGAKFIAFTFDDGYRDNFTEALKIFRDFGFPFAVNVTTGFVERTASVWWYTLEDILRQRDSLHFAWDGSTRDWKWASEETREKAFLEIAALIRNQGRADRDRLVDTICEAAGVDPLQRTRELIVDWDELKQFASIWHVTIGAHTAGHHTLARMSEPDLQAELVESKALLETKLGKKVRHLAYPFGGRDAVARREFDVARECDYETAVTTRTGNLFPDHAWHLQALPRLGISGNHSPVALINRLENGLVAARGNNWKRVVVD